MSRSMQPLVRLAAYAAGGLLASILASMLVSGVDRYFGVFAESPWSFTYFGIPVHLAWFFALGALVGIASGAGLELAGGARPRPAGRRHPTLWPWPVAACLGIVGGDLLIPQPWPSSPAVTVMTVVAVVITTLALSLVNGLAVGAGPRPSAFGHSLVALALSLVAGIAFVAPGGTLLMLVPHHCPPHGYCFEPPPPGWVVLSMAMLSLPVALWLGAACWLALGLGQTLRPHAWQEA